MNEILPDFDQDPDFLSEVIQAFVESVRKQVPRLKEAAKRGDIRFIVDQAHSIKGGAVNLKAESILKIAANLSLYAREGNFSLVERWSDRLDREIGNFQTVVQELAEFNTPQLK